MEFAVGLQGLVAEAEVVRTDLPREFGAAAADAMRHWLFRSERPGTCGFIRGRQVFRFDGPDGQAVDLGATLAKVGGPAHPLPAFDRVEVTGTRVHVERGGTSRAVYDEAARSRADALAASRWAAVGGRPPWPEFLVPHRTLPRPTVRVEPQFPTQALISRVEGTVATVFRVDADGKVTGVEVVDAVPRQVYEGVTLKAWRRWRFQPALDGDGQPVAMDVCQYVDFRVFE